MATTPSARRRFITTLIWLLGPALILGRFMLPRKQPGKSLFRISKSDVPHNGALLAREKRLAIVNRNGQSYALDLTCPHLGCTVNLSHDQFVCPCHGSRFDLDGRVLEGPAGRDLRQHELSEEGDELIIRG